MKKNLLNFLLITSSAIAANAQVTLTDSSFPAAGEVFNSTIADTAGVTAGAGGAAATWDFSTLTNSGAIQIDSFKMVSSTPYGGFFPLATICLHSSSPSSNSYIYFDNTGTTVERVGNATPSTGNIVSYPNTAIEYEFPFVYGNTFNDTYSSSYTSGSTTLHTSGTLTTTGDGYGTLITPLGSYSDVERITSVRHELDTVMTSGGTITAVMDLTYTNWYKSSKFYPLLSITKTNVTPSIGPLIHSKSVTYSQGMPTSINELSSDEFSTINAFPNPTTNDVTLHYFLKEKNNVKISITDVSGAIVFSTIEEQANGEQLYKLNTNAFAKGCYFYSVETKSSRFNGKLIISK